MADGIGNRPSMAVGLARALGCAALLAPALAIAALPIGETTLDVRFIDAKSTQAVAGVFVAATESYYWTGFHSSGTTCFRAASAMLDGKQALRLPAMSPAQSLKVTADTRHIELIAYRPGYCAAQPYANAGWAGFLKWANKNDPMGLWGTTASPDPQGALEIRLMPTSDPPERRLRHLVLVASTLASRCREVDAAFLAPMSTAIRQEAASLARNPVERLLAQRVNEAFDAPEQRKVLVAPLVTFASGNNIAGMKRTLERAERDPMLSGRDCWSQGHTVSCMISSAPGMEMPRDPFQIDERDERGFSALMAAAQAMQPDAVKWLLERGASINTVSEPGGYAALDLVLDRAGADVKEQGTEGQEIHLLRMIDLLVAHREAPTLHPRYREELADASKWKLTPHLASFWQEVGRRASALAARPAVTLACPANEPAKSSLGLRGESR